MISPWESTLVLGQVRFQQTSEKSNRWCVLVTHNSSRMSFVIEVSVFRVGDAILLGSEAVAV